MHKSKLPSIRQGSPVQGKDCKTLNLAVGDECNQDGVKEKGGETTEVVEEQIGQVLLLTLVCIPARDL